MVGPRLHLILSYHCFELLKFKGCDRLRLSPTAKMETDHKTLGQRCDLLI